LNRGDRYRPKKRLGQHFLKDTGIIHEIITRAELDASDRVLEIGAGLGALTLPLSGAVHQVLAVEKDSHLTGILKNKLSRLGIGNVTLINDDILKLDFGRTLPIAEKKATIFGNLPYNISSPCLEKIIQNRNLVNRAIIMLQLELAERLIASPGSKEYGAMTLFIQYQAHLSPIFEVPKEAFYPKPKVGSMVLALDLERPHPRRAEDEACFEMVVKGAFSHRRKTLLNSLRGSLSSYTGEEIQEALEICGIDPSRRAETLSIDEFIILASTMKRP